MAPSGRIVPEPLGNSVTVAEHPQEPAPITSDVEHARSAQGRPHALDHRLPDEGMLILHGFVLGGATPVRGGTVGFGHPFTLGRRDDEAPGLTEVRLSARTMSATRGRIDHVGSMDAGGSLRWSSGCNHAGTEMAAGS